MSSFLVTILTITKMGEALFFSFNRVEILSPIMMQEV